MKDTILFSAVPIDELHNISTSINPGMLLCYQYNPKYYDENMDDKSKFWMGITNIYTLFYDCGTFLFRGDDGNLLQLLQSYRYIKGQDAFQIRKFISDINGIRGFYCHNKIENCNDMSSEWNKSGISSIEPVMAPDSLRVRETNPDYASACAGLAQKTEEIYGIIKGTMEKLKNTLEQTKDDEFVHKWLCLQVSWLLKTKEIRKACIDSWFRMTQLYVNPNMKPYPSRLREDFMEKCCNILDKKECFDEMMTTISIGTVTVLGAYQVLYEKHEKEIKECMKELFKA